MGFIKNLIPESLLKFFRPSYHGFVALVASFYFGQPSEKMVVIGITGTAGKSTTVGMLAHILNFNGKKCGFSTTVNFFDGNTDYLNKHGLSMPGGWLLQEQLEQMLKNGCHYAIVECTSEGLAQNRHLGINFDVVLFTNLSRAHLEAHGTFGNYQGAKSKLFQSLGSGRRKSFFKEKMLGVNLDDPISGNFISFPADKKFGTSFKNLKVRDVNNLFLAKFTNAESQTEFVMDGVPFILNLMGNFNAYNAGLAAACANMLGVDLAQAAASLKKFLGVRGRMELVPNNLGAEIIVDYGCEPASFKAAVEAAAQQPHNRLIHVFGSTGGHRDKAKRFEFGKISACYADIIFITNDDIYNSDELEIAKNIESGILTIKLRKPPYEIILDRRAAIAKALSIAKKDDIILFSGKGSEQFLVLPGNIRVNWDEVEIVKQELNKISN